MHCADNHKLAENCGKVSACYSATKVTVTQTLTTCRKLWQGPCTQNSKRLHRLRPIHGHLVKRPIALTNIILPAQMIAILSRILYYNEL